MRWLVLAGLLAALAAAPGAGVSAPPRCGEWAVPARIAGKAVCLRDGLRCKQRLATQYRRYGFECPAVAGVLLTRWQLLRSRPVTMLRLDAGDRCPVTTESGRVGQYVGMGPGPAYPMGEGTVLWILPATAWQGWGTEWGGMKRVWLLDTRYALRALVRGFQLDGANELRLVSGRPGFTPAKVLNPVREQRLERASDHPSLTRLKAPGCYAYQVDTRTKSYLVVFEARLVD